MTLSDPGELAAEAEQPSSQPVAGVVTPPSAAAPQPAAEDDTPAYGIPVAPAAGPWQDGPAHAPHPAETMQLRAVPAPGPASGGTQGGWGGGGGGGPEERSGSASRRRPLALLIGAAATVALSGTAVAVWVLPASGDGDTALLDAKASAPAVSVAPVAPSGSPSHSSASPSASKSPTASKSASPSASPSASRSASSAPPSPSASPSPSRSSSPPPAQAPVLRYGDSGPEVEKLQRLLAAQGLYRGRFHGKFDWRVEDALSDFQYAHGIDSQEWGVYGPLTRKALEG
ncbi:peptidoglycan-binding protein [Streptomyces virginiae]|uniref:peptidoglycan-binding domain-containing protein n=1 Tax=Streptomyces virginiae TaxID=1961 RepID=UPI00382D2C47